MTSTTKIFKLAIIVVALLSTTFLAQAQKNKEKTDEELKIVMEQIQSKCENTPRANRVRVAVSSFEVATNQAPSLFGKEMKDMLENALQNVNCFNVLASIDDVEDMDDEMKLANSHGNKKGTSPKSGQMKGPQILVKGKITEYSDGGKSSTSFGGISVSNSRKAHIGFIVKLIDAETREIVASQSFNVDGSAGKVTSFGIRGFNRTEDNGNNKSLQNAMEKGVIYATEFLASKKSEFELPETEAQTNANKTELNANNCQILNGARAPKIMVILPEFHLTRRIPDPAAETEINRKLLEFGFDVVDAAMFATIANGESFEQAAKDPKKAISLGKQFGADIVIYGEAFSEYGENTKKGQVSCRARVEVKAVRTDNASMLASNGMEAGAIDNTEAVASKAALRNAGGEVADYIIQQLCKRKF